MFIIERIKAHRGYRKNGRVEEVSSSFLLSWLESFKNLELSGKATCSKILQHFTAPSQRSRLGSEPCKGESRLCFIKSFLFSKTYQTRSEMIPNTGSLFIPRVFPCGQPSLSPQVLVTPATHVPCSPRTLEEMDRTPIPGGSTLGGLH